MSAPVGIAGAGAWGIALAQAAAAADSRVMLWARRSETAHEINCRRANSRLPGIRIASEVTATPHLSDLSGCRIVILAAPSAYIRDICTGIAGCLRPGAAVCVAAKGIERGSGKLMPELVSDVLGSERTAVLSGPTFASEVAASLPCAVALAGNRRETARIAAALSCPAFRIYRSDDVPGVAVGGAVKNVIAIACGISAGLGFGNNARAALISRGLQEITRLGLAVGAKRETLSGLSGLGDLVLTCTSEQSRNYSYGLGIGRGASPARQLEASPGIVEGAAAAPAVVELAARLAVDMPISAAIHGILAGRTETAAAVRALLARPPESEFA